MKIHKNERYKKQNIDSIEIDEFHCEIVDNILRTF